MKNILCFLGRHESRIFEITKISSGKVTVGYWISHVCLRCHNTEITMDRVLEKNEAKKNNLEICK